MIRSFTLLLALMFLFTMPATGAAAIEAESIPPALKPWQQWVLHGHEARLCPPAYDNSENRRCIWHSRLILHIDGDAGRFESTVSGFDRGFVSLPGSAARWPHNVRLNGSVVPVVARNGRPAVALARPLPSDIKISGSFSWRQMPETLMVPPETGLVSLILNGKVVERPRLEKTGRLWLQTRRPEAVVAEAVDVTIFRKLVDEIPMQVTDWIRINVSGKPREIRIEKILLQEAVPMQISSPLPAKIEQNGDLSLQVRPGRWELQIRSRLAGSVQQIGPVAAVHGQEIWTFEARNDLRMVRLDAGAAIDPSQTDLPDQWRKLPAYLVGPGQSVQFKELRRGDPDPAPDRLHLKRIWWLDFKGDALTMRDRVSGKMSRQWYLSMNPPAMLGRVTVDGEPRLITVQGEAKKPGVQLRRGKLSLTADSRLDNIDQSIPAVGWDHDFESVEGVLNLPPGWRLLASQGVDSLRGTWVSRWTLLDFFLVLIIALAFWKIRGWPWGLVALITMALIYHEPGAPRHVWLSLLGAMALLGVLAQGAAQRLAAIWALVSIVVLVVVSIPFMVRQVRIGIYPQLDRPHLAQSYQRRTMAPAVLQEEETKIKKRAMAPALDSVAKAPRKSGVLMSAYQRSGDMAAQQTQAVLAHDPNAVIQTGPGVPNWKWQTFKLKWTGPVRRDQQVRLWLIPPWANLMLACARVLLVAVLILGLARWPHWRSRFGKSTTAALLVAACMLPLTSAPLRAEPSVAPFPPPQLLEQLRQRLLEPPQCAPRCADIEQLKIVARPDRIQLWLAVHAATTTAIPLPGQSGAWSPQMVTLDAVPLSAIATDSEGYKWALVSEGVHTIMMIGSATGRESLQIPLPLKPHQAEAEVDGWEVNGIDSNGRPGASIQLTRLGTQKTTSETLDTTSLPPFLSVRRTLHLGLQWTVTTEIKRLTPVGTPVTIPLPLIAGESLTTEDIPVDQGVARITLGSAEPARMMTSVLERRPRIDLTAPKTDLWAETWVLDASPVWHCQLSGIAVIHHQDRQGHWQPVWRPWPGEKVGIEISKPEPVRGQTVTIDRAGLVWTPGQRFNHAQLSLSLRTSRGARHPIGLPEGARLQQVRINDKSQPIRLVDGQIILPLGPGSQRVAVEWHQDRTEGAIQRAPQVDIGQEAVNAAVQFKLPRDRWILWTSGPRLGPAVLFWSYLVVVVLAAIGLSRIPATPLKLYHWLLLGVGLTQIHPLMALVVVAWLFALAVRESQPPVPGWFAFNLTQLILIAWTLAALGGLYMAVERGLLGIPDMQVAGNGSTQFNLNWFQDRIGAIMPQPWVLSLPRWTFHVLMLFWALWLALSLLGWLRWGWQCFGAGGYWRKPQWRVTLKRLQRSKPEGDDN